MRNRYTRNKNKGTHRLHNAPERDVYPRFVETMQLKVIETEKDKKTISINKEYKDVKMDIMEIILDYIYNNKSTVTLIEKLNSEQKYRKYGEYFERWISDTISKKQQMIDKVKKELQNGKNQEEIIESLSDVQKFKHYYRFFQAVIDSVEENNNEKGIEHE